MVAEPVRPSLNRPLPDPAAGTARPARANPIWRRPYSLQLQLVAWVTGVLLCMFILGTAAVAWRAVHTINSLDHRALQLQARDIARALSAQPDGRPVLRLPPGLAAGYASSGQAYLYIVLDRNGRVLFASDPGTPAGEMLARRMPPSGAERFFDFGDAADIGRYLAYARAAGPWRIGVAQASIHSDAVTDSLIEDFLEITIVILLPTLIVTTLVSVVTIRRSLRPVRRISAEANRITPAATGVRLPVAGLPAEIVPLVEAFNLAVDRLAAGFHAQRRFTADAAHELRTPLAVLMAHLDALPDQRIAQELRPDVKAMARVVEQLLSVARLEGGEIDGTERLDLAGIGEDVVRRLAPLAVRAGRTLSFAAPRRPAAILGDADAIATAVVNLVENAMIHGPPGSEVAVAVHGPATLTVSDRGPGIPAAERDRVLRRFARGAARRGSGAGIGLAIVAETMRAHGGAVEIADRPGGGCVVALRFPPAPACPAD